MSLVFVQPPGNTWKEKCKELFELYNVYRTIIVSDNVDKIACIMEEDLHSTYVLEGDRYYEAFEEFLESSKRILVMSYDQYLNAYEFILYMLAEEHNLLILEGLEPAQTRYILDQMKITKMPYYIWANNFLDD